MAGIRDGLASLVLLILAVAVLFVWVSIAHAGSDRDTKYLETQGLVILCGKTYEMAFDKTSGAISFIKDKTTGKRVFQGNADGILWKVGYLDFDKWVWGVMERGVKRVKKNGRTSEMPFGVAQFSYPSFGLVETSNSYSSVQKDERFRYVWNKKFLTLSYIGEKQNVYVICTPGDTFVDFQVEIANKGQTILQLIFPFNLTFDPENLKRFGFPLTLGIVFKRDFYLRGRHYEGCYPRLFSDFVFLESSNGTARIYGIQNKEIFVPAILRTGSKKENDGIAGIYDHAFYTFIQDGERWTSPKIRIEIGPSELKESVNKYCEENDLKKHLSDKMKPGMYSEFRRSSLLIFDSLFRTFRNDMRRLSLLPSPTIIILQHWMYGGFDKQYPNFLPPNPLKGSPLDFTRFCQRAKQLRLLVETYTNYTWVSTEPPSPFYRKHGADVFALNLDGRAYPELYASHGYTVTPSHPAVEKIHEETTRELVESYGVDIIYLDQIGLRMMKYDKNTKYGIPYAHIQDLIDIAREDSQFVPISCEGGFDRLMNYVSRFDWQLIGGPISLLGIMPGPGERFEDALRRGPEDIWEPYPWLLFMFHDKVSFSKGAGDFRGLSWAILIGGQLNAGANPEDPIQREWLKWIAALQKHVCSRYVGKRLTDFEFVEKNVYRSKFEDIHVICNLSPQSYRIPGDSAISPGGFYVTSQDHNVMGGVFSELNGIKYGAKEKRALFQIYEDRQISLFTFFNAPTTVSIMKPSTWNGFKDISVYCIEGDRLKAVPSRISTDRITFKVEASKITFKIEVLVPGKIGQSGQRRMFEPMLRVGPNINPDRCILKKLIIKAQ